MNLEKELRLQMDIYESGVQAEIVREEGRIKMRRVPTPGLPVREPMRQAEPQDKGVAGALADIPVAAAGMAKGAVEGTAGLPGDIYALGKGLYSAAFPEEGETRSEAFGRAIDEASQNFGAEAVRSIIDPVLLPMARKAGMSEEDIQLLQQGADVGQFVEVPGVGLAVRAGVKAAPGMASKAGDVVEGMGEAAKARMGEGGATLTSGIDPDPLIAAAGDAVKAMRGGEDKIISQRLPTAKEGGLKGYFKGRQLEDPIQNKLVTDTKTTLDQPPEKLKQNFQKISVYPNMPDNLADMAPEEAAKQLEDHIVSNLLFLHDSVPEATRARSKQWYDGANKISRSYADKYSLPLESVSAVMAALSPQKDWYQNADLGRRVIEIVQNVSKGNERGMTMNDEMMATMRRLFNENKPKDKEIMDAIAGKPFDQLRLPAQKAMWLRVYDETYNDRAYPIVNPEGTFGDMVKTAKGQNAKVGWGSLNEIGKAIIAIESGGDLRTISDAMGEQNKVRNFYNNIYNPNSANGDVTIDTHAVAAGMLRPLAGDATEVHHNFGSTPDKPKRDDRWMGGMSNTGVTGTKGVYGIYADAYRRAAKERGVLPREMQSITWEAVRGLYTDVAKKDKKFVDDINKIWYEYKAGNRTLEEAQNAAVERAGGIDKPTWEN